MNVSVGRRQGAMKVAEKYKRSSGVGEGHTGGEAKHSVREEHTCSYEAGPFTWKCSTYCTERTRCEQPAKELSLADGMVEDVREGVEKQRKSRPSLLKGLDLALLSLGGASLALAHTAQKFNVLKKRKPKSSIQAPAKIDASKCEEAGSRHDADGAAADTSDKSAECGHFAGNGPAEPALSEAVESTFNSSHAASEDMTTPQHPARCAGTQQQQQRLHAAILETEKKSREDVLAFTMQQSVLRQYEKNELKGTIMARDREIERKSETIDAILTAIAGAVGIEFSDVSAAVEETPAASCSKESNSESSTSPDSILTPKLLMKENDPDIWKIKKELILEKVAELKQNAAVGSGGSHKTRSQSSGGSESSTHKEKEDFPTFLQSFRVEQFRFFSEMKDKSFQLEEYSNFVSQWHRDIRVMKEKQAEHYQNKIDSLAAEKERLEEAHQVSLANLVKDHSRALLETKEHYQSEALEKENEIQLLTKAYEGQSDHLQREIFRLQDDLQATVLVAKDMEHDMNSVSKKYQAAKARLKEDKEEFERDLNGILKEKEKLETRIEEMEIDHRERMSELRAASDRKVHELSRQLEEHAVFLDSIREESILSAELTPESPLFDQGVLLDFDSSLDVIGGGNTQLLLSASSEEIGSIRRTLFEESSIESILSPEESVAKEIERYMSYLCNTIKASDLNFLTMRELEQMAASIRLRVPNIDNDFYVFISDLCDQGYLTKHGRLYNVSDEFLLRHAMLRPKVVSVNLSADEFNQSRSRYSSVDTVSATSESS